MKNIAFITENFLIPWEANDIDNFVGGSQECIILLSEELATKNNVVVVFSSGPTKTKTIVRKKVLYTDLTDKYDLSTFDIIILFKFNPFKILPKTKILYWSSDIEIFNFNIERICLTKFHASRNGWDCNIFPHGIDIENLNTNKTVKNENLILYSSSPDRGLQTLIKDWKTIQKSFPNMKLVVTYGFQIARQLLQKEEITSISENSLIEACKLLDVTFLPSLKRNDMEKLYWKSKYWILPLNNAESELFCLNAIKAQYCGCIPIVNKIGALTETVSNYIEYNDFVKGKLEIIKSNNIIPLFSWKEVVDKFWDKIL